MNNCEQNYVKSIVKSYTNTHAKRTDNPDIDWSLNMCENPFSRIGFSK